jgi:hypothetical protein
MGRGSPSNNSGFHSSNQLHQVNSIFFGVPHNIITDNGTNFTSKEFKNYCESMGIKSKFAYVAHPETNWQVEKANSLIFNGIKKRLLAPLEKAKHAWVDE